METAHRQVVGDARDLETIEDDSVELVVTSPPYPMIEMWDGIFSRLDNQIEDELAAGHGSEAYELMHRQLDAVWDEVARVLIEGGLACINIGDATRSIDGTFRVYQNHARIIDAFVSLGFEPLPDIVWQKPSNSAAKFMGSGMLPPNAYVTLEHEYVLVFRNGKRSRQFPPGDDRRYESSYFWEERNRWFSDVWTDVRGTKQPLDGGPKRDRSGAYPFEIPYRLINMYSVYGDTVLDPFWGTGTTSVAAMVAARNSIGYEIESGFADVFDDRVSKIEELSGRLTSERLANHIDFVQERRANGTGFDYVSNEYGFPVTTRQEQNLTLYTVDQMEESSDGYRVSHRPVQFESIDDT